MATALRGDSSGNSTSSASSGSMFAVRIVLASSLSIGNSPRSSDVVVSSNTNDSLYSIYNNSNVKARVRNGFNSETKRAVESGKKELILTYRNFTNERVYCQYLVKDLFLYRIRDLIASIPRDNNGPIDGAAFPITLVIDTRDCFAETDGEFM